MTDRNTNRPSQHEAPRATTIARPTRRERFDGWGPRLG
jgi:hypothetical protein